MHAAGAGVLFCIKVAVSHSARRGPRLSPAPRPDQIERVLLARLRAHREALCDAVHELPAAGGGVDAALVAHVPALRQLAPERDDGLAHLTFVLLPHAEVGD